MVDTTSHYPPRRITDLMALKQAGSQVTCDPAFDVLPVDFMHRQYQFQAFVFLCRYAGQVDENPYLFRKCYARGCPHNLCPHVAQAVMIANRYLQRDFKRLRESGITVSDKMFTLSDMVVKFEDLHEAEGTPMTIHDYINIAREGNQVSVTVTLEYVPAVEHFVQEKNKQTFLNGNFSVNTLGRTALYQRCLACYPTDHETREKEPAVTTANQRLALLYQDFDQSGIVYEKQFF